MMPNICSASRRAFGGSRRWERSDGGAEHLFGTMKGIRVVVGAKGGRAGMLRCHEGGWGSQKGGNRVYTLVWHREGGLRVGMGCL